MSDTALRDAVAAAIYHKEAFMDNEIYVPFMELKGLSPNYEYYGELGKAAITVTLDTVIAEIERRIAALEKIVSDSRVRANDYNAGRIRVAREIRDYLIALRDGAGTARAAEGEV